MSESGVKMLRDGLGEFKENILALKDRAVLIGIPEQENKRQSGEALGNAAIAYIQSTGSPVNNIPARPFMEPGLEPEMPALVDELRVGARDVFVKGAKAITDAFTRVGIKGQNAVKRYIIQNNSFAPLAESTLAERKRAGFKGKKALIRTAQMLNSLTFVIRSKK